MIHRIVQFALRQKPIVLFLVTFMAVGGALAFHGMPVDAYPDLSPPMVEVITQWPGHAAEEDPYRHAGSSKVHPVTRLMSPRGWLSSLGDRPKSTDGVSRSGASLRKSPQHLSEVLGTLRLITLSANLYVNLWQQYCNG